MFGGPGGATRRQRTGTGRQIRAGWQKQESLAGKDPWEDGGSRKHIAHCQFAYRRERGQDGGQDPHRRQQCRVGMGHRCHPWTIPACPWKTLQGAAAKSWSWRHSRGHEHEAGVMLGTIISPRLPNRVFWLNQLKIRLLLIISTGHSCFNFSFIYIYVLPCAGRET